MAAVVSVVVLTASAIVATRHLAPTFTPGAMSLGSLAVASVALSGQQDTSDTPAPRLPCSLESRRIRRPLMFRRELPRPIRRPWMTMERWRWMPLLNAPRQREGAGAS